MQNFDMIYEFYLLLKAWHKEKSEIFVTVLQAVGCFRHLLPEVQTLKH